MLLESRPRRISQMNNFQKIIIVLIGGMLLFALAGAQQQPNTSGRFQIVANGTERDGHFLLNTSSGQVWREITLSSASGDDNGLAGEPEVWVPMTRLNSAAEVNAFVARNPKEDSTSK
jgi:hypothetical protein